MHRPISILFVLCFFLLIPSLVFSQSGKKPKVNKEVIYYFIDTDCLNCSIQGSAMSKIWVTSQVYSGVKKDQQVLINIFKEKLATQLSADSSLLGRTVFRWDNSESNLQAAFMAKEAKMQLRGYRIVRVELQVTQ